MRGRVLVIEDDAAIRRGIADALAASGYHALTEGDGDGGLAAALAADVDLVLLDVVLPRRDGFAVLEQVRRVRPTLPVIMLTARGAEQDRVRGLQTGADDYVVKPFSVTELLARVEAVLRRSSARAESSGFYEFGDVRLDFRMLEATKGSQPLDLSPLEFKLMKFFIDNRQQVVTRDQMLKSVWNSQSALFTRTVDMHVAKLRKKIEDSPNHPRFIITIYGVGYKFLG